MRAVLCREFGPLDKLEMAELPAPVIVPGSVRVAVHAVGVNFADLLIVQGKYQEKPPLPFSPGFEIAGVVTELGPGVDGVKLGDRVLGTMEHGAYADEAVLAADRVLAIPAAMDFPSAAGFPVAYGTSHGALEWRARLKHGETLLVLGAAGGVGLTAVEIGKAMGATVIAVAGGSAKLEVARRQGADHVIDYSREDLRERIKEITGGHGPDVIYDPVGGDVFDLSTKCIAPEGRLLVIGFASGRIPSIAANRVLLKNMSLVGVLWGGYVQSHTEYPAEVHPKLMELYSAKKIRPAVGSTRGFSELPEALRGLANREVMGKALIVF